MKQKSLFLLLIFSFFSSLIQAQWVDFSGEVNLRGLGSTREELPFWMYHNQRGRISENTNVAGWVTGKAIYHFNERHSIDFSAGILYQDDFHDEIFIDEIYAHYENPWFYATLGRKQQPSLYNGLSASNYNILWSLNAQPLPGIQVGTTEPFFFTQNSRLGFEASWEDYLMGKDNYIEDARLHHKSFRLVYRSEYDLQLKIGVEHFAQWGGTSPNGANLFETRGNYLEVVIPSYRIEPEPHEHKNAPGHHLGGYVLEVSRSTDDYNFQFLYNYLFEDNTTAGFENFPDGRYGIFAETTEEDRIVNSLMYEFYSLRAENYFMHGTYKSGWTYRDRILGAPFFDYDPETGRIINNRFTAHHIGIGGQFGDYFNTYPYRLLLSYSINEGTRNDRYSSSQDVFATYFDMKVFSGLFDVNVQLATEFNSFRAPAFGAGVHLRYRL